MIRPELEEIYKLVFYKKFRAVITLAEKDNEYLLFLYAPSMKYYTAYKLMPGKIKWEKGVDPFRIIKK